MAQTYTLDEAARRLSLSPEEFKRRIKDEWKSVRSFRDGPTLRFRAADIDELARMLGEASDPGLQLGPVGEGSGEVAAADDSDHFAITDDHPSDGPSTVASGVSGPFRPPADPPLGLDTAPPAFDFTDSGSRPKIDKTGTDSDVRVEPAGGSGRLGADALNHPPTEEIAVDLSGPGSAIIRPSSSAKLSPGGASGKLSGPPSGKLTGPTTGKLSGPPSGKIPGPTSGKVNPADGSSEFELSLDADSDSFELQLSGDGSDEVGLDLSPPAGDRGGLSGINLGRPADSGISLERPSSGGAAAKPGKSGPKGGRPADDDGLDFDLSFDDAADSGPKTAIGQKGGAAKSGPPSRAGAAKSKPPVIDSDSEFELTLDDNSGVVDALGADLQGPKTVNPDAPGGDIFETDFELPVADDSGSEVVAVDGASDVDADAQTSDFDIALSEADAPADDDSASQVVLVDDEPLIEDDGGVVVEEDDAVAAADLQEGPSASKALRGASRSYEDDEAEEDYGRGPVRTVAAAPAPWGPLPAVILLPCLLLTFVGSIMSFELLRGMWGYHQPTPPGNIVVRSMADAIGMKTGD